MTDHSKSVNKRRLREIQESRWQDHDAVFHADGSKCSYDRKTLSSNFLKNLLTRYNENRATPETDQNAC